MIAHKGKLGMGVLASIAFIGGPLIASSPALAQTSPVVLPSLTAAQRTQAAQVARTTEDVNTHTGYVSVSPTALAQQGLSASQVAYVESTIQQYDDQSGLHATSTTSSTAVSPSDVSPNAGIWYKSAAFTHQMVMLYEGEYSEQSWGWLHMSYRHNWNTAAAQKAVEIAVHQAQYYSVQSNGRYEYDKWFTTTIPFESWSVLMMIVVSPGNATGNDLYGPGSVVTGYPIAGSYKISPRDGKLTSIVPWWINDGYYAQTLN